ncbi:putative two-component system sensor kinase [Azoarcus olearius]|uniref:sensor histidine kinase n=1 Tax=Azoarcus sp. (strain BH72) TaxID=418699 RepID=UPI0008060D90|nr:HAMP domain-containing sensor histidine kinase [Azoarcus olearius]ANQ85931.1 putative two-component system sensor kinase [Azoarcus olearius]
MRHPSFRFTLLAGFLLVAGVLGAIAASAWLGLADFAARTRAQATEAIAMSAALQQLGERTIDLERALRQFLVLRDPALLERIQSARAEATAALDRLDAAHPVLRGLSDEWRRLSEPSALAPETVLPHSASEAAAALQRLREINATLARRLNDLLESQKATELDALDQRREQLAAELGAGVVLAALFALLIAWWILRPLRQLSHAIAALGEDRLAARVAVGGPADLRELGTRLDWLRQRLADLEANRNRVLRHVSHELKTPLASLREGIALLTDGVPGPLNAAQREVTGILAANARSLQERIEQLLDYNASQFNAAQLNRRPVSLRELAAAVLDELRLPAESKGLKLSLEGEVPALALDADKMRVVLSNLITNAIAVSPAGGGIRLSLSQQRDGVSLDCTDDGPGVAPEDAERIFEPFVRGPTAAGKGSGLGLAIAREFVRAHGGIIGLRPASRGACFHIELPYA